MTGEAKTKRPRTTAAEVAQLRETNAQLVKTCREVAQMLDVGLTTRTAIAAAAMLRTALTNATGGAL